MILDTGRPSQTERQNSWNKRTHRKKISFSIFYDDLQLMQKIIKSRTGQKLRARFATKTIKKNNYVSKQG
jgi:hypothetical protein